MHKEDQVKDQVLDTFKIVEFNIGKINEKFY